MAEKTRFDIDSENLDLFFEGTLATLSKSAKADLPKDILHKISQKGGRANSNSTSRLNFIAKLWILWKYLNKRFWIVIEDEEKGLSIEQFFELRDAAKSKSKTINKEEEMIAAGMFVTASKELGDAFSVLNRMSASNMYHYIQRAKYNVKLPTKSRAEQWKKDMTSIARFVTFYESNKKKWVQQNVITIPEYYVLLALYGGEAVKSSDIYKVTFKYAYQSSGTKIRTAFSSLQKLGYIEKIGKLSGTQFKITPLGTDAINAILTKYALNC